MNKTKMLKKNYEFRYVLSKGKYYAGNYIECLIIKNKKNYNLLGIAISTKAGKAVKRNRIKRLIRENYRKIESNIKSGNSMVFLAKKNKNIDEIDYKKIESDMYNIFKKADLIK